MRIRHLSSAALLLFACKETTPQKPPSQPTPAPQLKDAPPPKAAAEDSAPTSNDPPDAMPKAAATVPGAPVLVSTKADFDGKPGPESVALHKDGTLVAGGLRGEAELTKATDVWLNHQGAIHVVTLDRKQKTRAIVVALPTAETPDPPNRYQIFLAADKKLRRVLDRKIGTYGVVELRFPGDGSMRYIESDWTACEREAEPGKPPFFSGIVTRQEVILRLDKTGVMVEAARRPTNKKQDCTMLAACPFVYIGDERIGEILRNLRGSKAYALQSLALPNTTGRTVEIRLAEEKPEVTFLDEIYVEINGERIEPAACETAKPPAYCVADHRPHVLRRGESLDLTFEVASHKGVPLLFARGYYVPTR